MGRGTVVAVLFTALMSAASACSDSASETAPRTGLITQIGPRVIDTDLEVMVIVDSVDDTHDDVRLRLRVVNLDEAPFDVGAEDTFYAPLVVLRDDLDNTYEARAVEPAKVDGWSVGHFDLRVEGPFDPDATEFSLELTTNRGLVTIDSAPAPVGDVAQWWLVAPAITFSDLSARGEGGRTVEVLGIADRGSHVEVEVRATDPEGFALPDDVPATLTSADGDRLESLPSPATESGTVTTITGVLTFPGTLPVEEGAVTLNMAGVEVVIPAVEPPTEADGPQFAELPRLPDLIHARISNEPLPASTLSATT